MPPIVRTVSPSTPTAVTVEEEDTDPGVPRPRLVTTPPSAPKQPLLKLQADPTWWERLLAFFGLAPARPEPKAPPTFVSRRPPLQVVPTPPKPTARLDRFVTTPVPWEGAEPPLNPDPALTRARLVERLYVLREGAPTPNDWRFVDRLLRECLSARLDFPLFPAGALRLDRLLRSGDPNHEKVAEIVRQEPGLVQRVWQEAQSAAYNGNKPSTLEQAIVRLGHKRLWQVAMSASMNAQVFKVRSQQARADHLRELSIVSAEVSNVFATDGDPYLSALLHALGKLVVYRCGPGRGPEEAADPEFVATIADLVHPSVGVLAAEAWNLDPAVAAGIAFAPAPYQAPPGLRSVAVATHAARVAAHEAHADREGKTYDGLRELMELGYSPEVAAKGLEAADAAWRKVRATSRGTT